MQDLTVDIICNSFTHCDTSWGVDFHGPRQFYRIYFPVSGDAKIIIDGAEQVMRSGKGYFMDVHRERTHWTDNHFDIFWLHFTLLSLEKETMLRHSPAFFEWPHCWCKQYKQVIELLSVPFAESSDADKFRINAMLFSMLADVLDSQSDIPTLSFPQTVNEAMLFMDARYDKFPSLEEISAYVDLTPNYFHRLFRNATGTTPYEYMLRRRMNAARRLILTTDMPIQEISEKMGYNNPFYFSRAFRKYYYTSPSEMRHSNQP